jgi:hypothetical protein
MSQNKKNTSEEAVSSHKNGWINLGSADDDKDYAALTKAAEEGNFTSLAEAYKYSQHSLDTLGVVGLLFAIMSDINFSLTHMRTSVGIEDEPKFLSCDALVKGIQDDLEVRSNEGNKLTEITLKLVLLFKKMHELSDPSGALLSTNNLSSTKGDKKGVGAGGSVKSQLNGASVTSSSSSALVSSIFNKESQLIAKKGGQSKGDNKKEKPVSQHASTVCSEELEDDWVDVGDVVKEDGYAALRRAANAGNVELFVKLWRQSCQDPPVSESKETGVKGLISIVNQMLDLIKPIHDQASEKAGALSEKRPVLVSGKIDPATIKKYFGALNEMGSYLTKPRPKKIPEKSLIKIMTDLTTIIEKIKETGSVSVAKERQEKEDSKAPSSHRPGQAQCFFVGKEPADQKEQGSESEFMIGLAALKKRFDEIAGGEGEDLDPGALDKCCESVDGLMRELHQLQRRAETSTSLSTNDLRKFTFSADALADSITVWKQSLVESLELASVSFSN